MTSCLSYWPHLAWKTRPKAPSPMSLTYWILFRGYSRASSFEFSSRGTRWYMGFGWSRSSRSSDGRALSVGVSMALEEEEGGGTERRGGRRRRKAPPSCCNSPLPVSPLLPPPVAGDGDDGDEDGSCQRGEDDDDDGHGVGRRRRYGGGQSVRGLTGAR